MEIAIIGVGKVAQDNYIPTLLRHKDVSVTGYSRTFERTEAIGQRFGIRTARTLDELFERQPDAVLLLTREDQRLEATQSLLPFKPKHLFFEKPLVAKGRQAHVTQQDFWDAKNLLIQAQEAGTETAMVFNYRFFDQIQRAKRLIQERNFGKAISVVTLTHFACWSHCIDLIMNFVGPVREISAHQGTQPYPFEDGEATDVAASLMIGDHATGVLLGTSGINWNFPLCELTVNFESGRFHFRDLDQNMEALDYRSKVHEIFSPSRDESRWTKYNESFEKSIDAYLDSIRKGAPPPVPGIAGLLELQFEASLKKSIAERRPVLPSEEFPTDPVR
ncbi:MAG TPA: Gfo/Idh/MocA family oxidoreductase [Anaerolineales bacterium]|nr:Gfo/Idh/MocA family oxidoreductase [Anaerolineales bacterium]